MAPVFIVGVKIRTRSNHNRMITPLIATPLIVTTLITGSAVAISAPENTVSAATPPASTTSFGSDARLSATQTTPGSTIPSSSAPSPGAINKSRYNGVFDLGKATHDPSVGGLSGLTSLADGSYLAISDDKGDHGPTRAYRLNIDNNGQAQVIGRVVFTNPDGSAYNPKEFDAEEIRQLPNGHLLWTTEGGSQGTENGSPAIIESDKTGREIRRIHPPQYHVPNREDAPDTKEAKGISPNKGPEGMTISPDGKTFYTINENSLVQDGPSNTPQSGSKTRLTVYNTATGKPSAEYVVDVDPTYAPKADRGYASLATSPDGNLYALQRGYIPKQGNRAEIYRLDVNGATNVLGRERLNGTEVAVNREKVFDFVDSKPGKSAHPGAKGIPESPDNVEGMAFEPRQPAPRTRNPRVPPLVVSPQPEPQLPIPCPLAPVPTAEALEYLKLQ